MFWGGEVVITKKSTIAPHSHEMWELVVCLSDVGRHLIGEKTYGFKTGRTFLLPSGVRHQALSGENAACSILFLCFDLKTDIEYLPPALTALLPEVSESKLYASANDAVYSENVELAALAAKELRGRRFLSQAAIGALLYRLLTNHFRSFEKDDDPEVGGKSSRIAAVLREIKRNPRISESLSAAARSAGMSRSLFTREFRALTGTSFVDYVNSARIGLAIELLTSGNDSISEVAAKCGFENLGYFHRVFKKHTNSTPLRLRRAARETGHPPLR